MTMKVTGSVLANTAVTAGTYGGATQHAVVTVDQQGRATFAANATPSIANNQITGVITGSQLANTAVTPGTYGDSANIPVITVDQQGRMTSAANVALTIPAGGFSNMVVLTSNNASYSIPATKIKVTVVGGGAVGGTGTQNCGSGYGGNGGGAGGAAIQIFSGLTIGSTLNVVVGAGGTTVTGSGSTSSVSSGTQTIATVSATGGSSSGPGGVGSGGLLNIGGSSGGPNTMIPAAVAFGSNGGNSIFGGGGQGGSTSNGGTGGIGRAYGGGGGGGFGTSPNYNGGAGAAGVVVIEY